MKSIKATIMVLLLFVTLFTVILVDQAEAQNTIYTNSGKSKYVKTAVDTFSVPGVTGVSRKGFVTNQSGTKQLLVYFSDRYGVKDTSSKVLIEPGKTLHFAFSGTKIFRNAVTDSAYSQIIIGDVQLNSLYKYDNNELTSIESFAVLNRKLKLPKVPQIN